MTTIRNIWLGLLALLATATTASVPAAAQQQQKPNIVVIMGDDIGWMQPSIYHEGLMVGETPNIERIGHEGAKFMDYLAMQSCTSGRNAFFTGMYPLRTGMIPPQLPGSPSWLRKGTPAMAVFLRDLGYTTGEFGKNHLGDHAEALPTAHGFQEYWGWLYHLDAMQQVSFPDINSSVPVQDYSGFRAAARLAGPARGRFDQGAARFQIRGPHGIRCRLHGGCRLRTQRCRHAGAGALHGHATLTWDGPRKG